MVTQSSAAAELVSRNPFTCCPLYRGSNKETRGTAYVVYEDIYDAKTAVEHLSGFNVANRYLIVLYYNHNKHSKKVGRLMCRTYLLQYAYDARPFISCSCMVTLVLLPAGKRPLSCSHTVCTHLPKQRGCSLSKASWFAVEYKRERGGAAQDAREVWRRC